MALPPINSRIKKAIENNTLVIFVGAGLSKLLDIPNWRELIGKFAENISIDYPEPKYKRIPENLTDGSYDELHALDLLKTYTPTLLSILDKHMNIDLTKKDLSLHKKLWQISHKIITTNYDRALEQADGVVQSYVYDSHFHMAQLAGKPQYLFKLHGCISRPDTCILFREQYDELYNVNHPAEFELKTALAGNTVLFIGFGMNDPYINYVLGTMKTMYHSLKEPHFWLTTDAKDLKEEGIEPIVLDSYAELSPWLDQLVSIRQAIVEQEKERETALERTVEKLNLSEQQIAQLKKDKKELIESLDKTKEGDKLKAQAKEDIQKGNYEDADQLLAQSALDKVTEVAETFYERGKLAKLRLKYQEALEYFELAVKLQPDNSLYLGELGLTYYDIGSYNEAMNQWERGLNIEKDIYGENHIRVATFYNNLGGAWSKKGKYDDAIKHLAKALKIYADNFGEDHPHLAHQFNNLGLLWYYKGDYNKANDFCEKALKISLRVFGEDHYGLTSIYINLGNSKIGKHLYDDAIDYFSKALNISINTLGEKHLENAYRYNNLGGAWFCKKEYDKAIEYFEQALGIELEVYGENHPDIAIRYNNLGAAWKAKGYYHQAQSYIEKSLKINKEFLDDNHPHVQRVKENLAHVKELIKNQQENPPTE